jgi:hypothetical protein
LTCSSLKLPHQRCRSSPASSSACRTARCTGGTSCSVPRSQGSSLLSDIAPPRRTISLSLLAIHHCKCGRERPARAEVITNYVGTVPAWLVKLPASEDARTYITMLAAQVCRRGPVAQLDRALRFERRGWEFKSLRVHHSTAFRTPGPAAEIIRPRKTSPCHALTLLSPEN